MLCLWMKKALSGDFWHPATCFQAPCFSLNPLTEGSQPHASTTVSGCLLHGCMPKCSMAMEMGCAPPRLQPPGWYFPSFCLTDTRALQEISPGFGGLCKNLLFEQLWELNVSALKGWAFLGCKFLMKALGYECVIVSLLFLTAWHPVGLS